jgi:predicted DNA-binding transcriptional regulator YafY
MIRMSADGRMGMRRADRLFQIIQILRRSRRPVTADAMAEELETSKRTIYRDIADLMAQRAPIRGEAGVGYVLDDGFDMPPLMLTPDEVEAAVLGAQLVARQGDLALARAAEDLVAKIRTVVPERLRPLVLEPSSRVAPNWRIVPDRLDMGAVRLAIRSGKKIKLRYRDEQERTSERTVWPFAVGYHESVRLLMAWCELRTDFRSFRTDRVDEAQFLEERYPERPAMLRARWRRQMTEMAQRTNMREAAGRR